MDKELWDAAGRNDVAAIWREVRLGANLEWRNPDKHGYTPMHRAADNGHVEAVRALLEAGAEVEAKDEYGHTPLHAAAVNGRVEAVRVLLGAGADVAGDCEGRWTPLHGAAQYGQVQATRALLQAGAHVGVQGPGGFTPLHRAAEYGHVEAVRALLTAGAEVGAKSEWDRTPLHNAAKQGSVEVVLTLLAAHADTGAQDAYGYTPLHAAASNGRLEAVQALLGAGADVGTKNKNGKTASDMASGSTRDAIKQLLEAAARRLHEEEWVTPPAQPALVQQQQYQQHHQQQHQQDQQQHQQQHQQSSQQQQQQQLQHQQHQQLQHQQPHQQQQYHHHHQQQQQQLQLKQQQQEWFQHHQQQQQQPNRHHHQPAARPAHLAQPVPHQQHQHQHLHQPPAMPAHLAQPVPHQLEPLAAFQWSAILPHMLTQQQVGDGSKLQLASSSSSSPSPASFIHPPPPAASPAFYAGGSITLGNGVDLGHQVSALDSKLVAAGQQAVMQIVNGVATCNPLALLSVPMLLVRGLQEDVEAVKLCRGRVVRAVKRCMALEPALLELRQELQPGIKGGLPEGVVVALCKTLVLLLQALFSLKELLPKLVSSGTGALERVMRVLKAQGYKQELDLLEQELRDCLQQLSSTLGIASTMQVLQAQRVLQVLRERQELQVAEWRLQDEADHQSDMAQVETRVLEVVGGVHELQQQLEEQPVLLDGQAVGLQQVTEWLQKMHAGNGLIAGHLRQMGQQLEGISEDVGVVRADVGVVRRKVLGFEDRLDSMQDELHQLFAFMHGRGSGSRNGRAAPAPTIVIPRSQIVMPADALANGDSGAFGTVVRAVRDGGEVAIKVYNHRKLGELDSEEAMEEALLLSKANHHNVVRCYGIVHDPDTPEGSSLHGSLVMEWVGGGNLYMWLQRSRALPLPGRLQLALQVSAGMRHLHERRLVHGDLKPQNVLLTPLLPGMEIPQVKICDFGLAKHTSTSLQHTYQEKKAFTPAYTSPERIDDFHRTREDDVYAFGILLYFIMTGSTPFSHIPANRLEAAIQRGVRPDMGAWVDKQASASISGPILQQVTAEVASLAAQCWSAEARQRPTIEAVHADLSGMLARLWAC